ncbi:MAG: N-acetyl-gamma-glutamyl-phosphate reductase, partial [Bacteroidetes bacterium QS_1_65_9]
MNDFKEPPRVALLHGAGYVGGELLRLLDRHPGVRLTAVTSSTFAGQPVWEAHPALRSTTDRPFSEHADLDAADALVTAAGHGQSAHELPALLTDNGNGFDGRFDGAVVDLSADFRHDDPASYNTWYDYEHPAPELLDTFAYGLPEVRAPYRDTQRVANPGCFATGLA